MLDAFKNSEPFKGIEEIRKENRDENKIIGDLRALYEPQEEDYYKSQKIKGAFDDDYIEYESNGDKDKELDHVRPYLSSIIDDHKDGWKIQLAMEVSFVSIVKDSNEHFTMHRKSENSSIFIGYETDNVIEELFKSLSKEYQVS